MWTNGSAPLCRINPLPLSSLPYMYRPSYGAMPLLVADTDGPFDTDLGICPANLGPLGVVPPYARLLLDANDEEVPLLSPPVETAGDRRDASSRKAQQQYCFRYRGGKVR